MSFVDNLRRNGRRAAKATYIGFLFLSGLLWWARRRVAELGVVVVTLHRVLPDSEYESAQLQPGMAFRAGTFQRFLEYLKSNCACVLPGDVNFEARSTPSSKRPRLAITFDDGWKDNFETAFPINRKHGIPFTIFICPEMITRREDFWITTIGDLWGTAQKAEKLDLIRTQCESQASGSLACLIESLKHISAEDRESRIVQLQAALEPYTRQVGTRDAQLLTWSQVKEMSAAGISFGSHTNTHAILTDIPGSQAAQELTGSKKSIEEQLKVCSTFAYPNGDWSPQVRDLVEQSGYQAAFINSPGIWQANSDRFSIPRVNLWEGSLAGYSGRFSRLALEYAIFWKAYRASVT